MLLQLRTPERHVIIQNLPPATGYRIRVSAYNDEGESLPSSALVMRTLDENIGGMWLRAGEGPTAFGQKLDKFCICIYFFLIFTLFIDYIYSYIFNLIFFTLFILF